MTRREVRSRDRATSGGEEKPPRFAAILSRGTPLRLGDKAARGGKRVSAEIFFGRGVYIILGRATTFEPGV